MGKRPTEEDLGIAPTAEEQEILSRPPAPIEPDDDIPVDREDEEEVVAAPKPAAEAPVRVKDPVTGKFVAKPKDEPAKVEAPAPVAEDTRKVDLRALQEERALRRQTEERMQV